MQQLTLAIPTGRLREECLDFLKLCGWIKSSPCARKLLWETPSFRILEVKPVDVPVYVSSGIADCGLVGKDILLEQAPSVYELLDCQRGSCRLSIARPAALMGRPIKSIATKFANIAQVYCRQHGIAARVIKLNGSVELAPLVGLADAILDLVATGRTLEANGLVEETKVADISVRLVVNQASFQIHRSAFDSLVKEAKAQLSN